MNVEQLIAILGKMPPEASVHIEMCDPYNGTQNHPAESVDVYDGQSGKTVRICWCW